MQEDIGIYIYYHSIYPDCFNTYIAYLYDGNTVVKGSSQRFVDISEDGKPVTFKLEDVQTLNSPKLYLLTEDLANKIEAENLSFGEVVKSYEKIQTKANIWW